MDGKISGFSTGDFKADGSVTATGSFNMGSNKITNIINGVNPSDVMNRGYIDGEVGYV